MQLHAYDLRPSGVKAPVELSSVSGGFDPLGQRRNPGQHGFRAFDPEACVAQHALDVTRCQAHGGRIVEHAA